MTVRGKAGGGVHGTWRSYGACSGPRTANRGVVVDEVAGRRGTRDPRRGTRSAPLTSFPPAPSRTQPGIRHLAVFYDFYDLNSLTGLAV